MLLEIKTYGNHCFQKKNTCFCHVAKTYFASGNNASHLVCCFAYFVIDSELTLSSDETCG